MGRVIRFLVATLVVFMGINAAGPTRAASLQGLLADLVNHGERLKQARATLRRDLTAVADKVGPTATATLRAMEAATDIWVARVAAEYQRATQDTSLSQKDMKQVQSEIAGKQLQADQMKKSLQEVLDAVLSARNSLAATLQALSARGVASAVPEERAGAARAAITTAVDTLDRGVTMLAATRSALAGLVPTSPLTVAPPMGLPAPSVMVMGSFDQDVGVFHVKLENGNANISGNTATLSGTVAVWPKVAPSLKMTVRNANVTVTKTGTTQNIAGLGRAAGTAADTTVAAMTAGTYTPVGQQTGTAAGTVLQENWVSVRGSGTLDLAGGPVTLTIAGGTFESRPDGTASLTGGDVSLRGCTHRVGQGSQLGSADVQLKGSLQCGGAALVNSTLRLSGVGIGGSGQLQAFGHTFTMTYAATDQNFSATGTWTATSKGWQAVPNVGGAEYEVTNPRATATLSGSTVTFILAVDDVKTRTTAKKPDGNPVAQAGSGFRSLPLNSSGDLGLPLPSLPQPNDVNRGARDACRGAVAAVPDYLKGRPREEAEKVRNDALAACDAANPFPPSVPSLPGSITVNLTTVAN